MAEKKTEIKTEMKPETAKQEPVFSKAAILGFQKYAGRRDLLSVLLEEKDYQIVNIDATIIAQRPRMASHIPDMVKHVAETLHLEPDQVNIKATTEEGLGFTGAGEGISAQAICSLLPIEACIDEDLMIGRKGCEGCKGCPKN